MCKFKSNAETRYFCAFPSSDSRRRACDLGVISVPARSSRQSRPSGVVEHVRPDAIDASSLWRGLFGGVEGEAAAWSSRVGRGAARTHIWSDARRPAFCVYRGPGSCAPLADRPPRDSRLCDAAAAARGSRTRFRTESGLQKAPRPPTEALRPGSRPENGPSETETDPTPYASRGQPLTCTSLPSQNRCANASPSQRLTAALAPQPPRTLCTPLHSFAR